MYNTLNISLMDLFAAAALTGLLASESDSNFFDKREEAVEEAFKYARLMVKESVKASYEQS